MKAKAWVMTFDAKTSEISMNPLITCTDCKHCTKSDLAGFWHCEAWGQEISMKVHDPYKYFCAEGERE